MFSEATLFAQQIPVPIRWSIAAHLPADIQMGIAGPVAGTSEDMLLVGGGANFPDKMPWDGGAKKYHDQLYVYDRSFQLKGSFTLTEPIAYAASCEYLNGLVYAGGENAQGLSKKVFLLRWDAVQSRIVATALPDLPIALTNAAAAVVGSTLYVVGGETKDSASARVFCLLHDQWKALKPLPVAVSHAVLVSKDAYLYVLGGRCKTSSGISTFYRSVYTYDLLKDEWISLPELPYAMSAGTGVINLDGVLLFGGDRGATFHQVEQYVVAISLAKEDTAKQTLIAQKNALQLAHPGFSKEILCYDLKTGKTKIVGEMGYPTPVTTRAFWWNEKIILPSGEIRAGVRTPLILTGKL